MLKLRARIRLATRLSTPGRLSTIATRMWRWTSPDPGRARVGGAEWAGPGVAPLARAGTSSSVGSVPLLDQVGQALAGGHHRKDVLGLGNLKPDQGRSIDGLGRLDRRVHLVRGAGPEGRDSERIGELGEVWTEQVSRVIVAGIED